METPAPPPASRARKGGIRHKPGPRPGQKPFDPLSQTWVEQGQSWLARKPKTDRERKKAEAEWLARHLQLSEKGSLPEDERSHSNGLEERAKRYAALTAYPRIPEGELARLEGIIKKYGLPLSALSSDTAAFVVRRVMMDFHRLSTLRRAIRKPMFTPVELIELMRVMRLKPTQLAEMVAPGVGVTRDNAVGSIHRWMHGASQPTSVLGVRLNRMIEQNVRRKGSGGNPEATRGVVKSDKKETAKRRARKARAAERVQMEIPLSYAAQQARKAREEADATDEG